MLFRKIAGMMALGLLTITAQGQAQYMSSTNGSADENDIVATAIAAGSFETLVTAVKAAGLVETLRGEGPFTVFAPTDDAFAKLPAGTVEELVKPENRAKLQAILKYHVVPGRLMAKDVVSSKYLTTVQGQQIRVSLKDGSAYVDAAKVVKTDIATSNGIIHVIDAVILPESK